MNLLLLLTALIASLTGAGAGERVVRQVQGVAVVQGAAVAQAAVRAVRHVPHAASAPVAVAVAGPGWTLAEAAPSGATHLPFERRLE